MTLPYIDYRSLANHLQTLDVHADNAALLARLRTFAGAERLIAAVQQLPPDAEWLTGLQAISATLHGENRRFDRGMFEEWCCERY